MDERKVREAIAVLDDEVPRASARVKLAQYGGGPDESQIIANETGFLRMGVELLKAAQAPATGRDGDVVPLELDYLLTGDSDIQFTWVERREPGEAPPERVGPWIPLLFLAVCAIAAVLAIIGLIVVLRWITS